MLSREAQALDEALNDHVDGCYCSDERWLCDPCLEHAAQKVLDAADAEVPIDAVRLSDDA